MIINRNTNSQTFNSEKKKTDYSIDIFYCLITILLLVEIATAVGKTFYDGYASISFAIKFWAALSIFFVPFGIWRIWSRERKNLWVSRSVRRFWIVYYAVMLIVLIFWIIYSPSLDARTIQLLGPNVFQI